MGSRLLLIDDEKELLHAYLEILSDEGYQAQGISDCHDALALLKAGNIPDLILLDARMPEMNGSEFLNLLREQTPEVFQQAKIYIFSALGKHFALSQEIEPLIKGVVDKPSDLFEFVALIRDLCNDSPNPHVTETSA